MSAETLRDELHSTWVQLTTHERIAIRLYWSCLGGPQMPEGLFHVVQLIHKRIPSFTVACFPLVLT